MNSTFSYKIEISTIPYALRSNYSFVILTFLNDGINLEKH